MDRLIEFVGNHPVLFLALAGVIGMLAWSFLQGSLQGFKTVGPVEATQLINHKDAVVLDLREESEVRDGVILNSIHIPLGQLKDNVGKLGKHKEKPMITLCRTGSRSNSACVTLVKNGFAEVYNLQGGITAWRNANLPLAKKK